MIQRGDSVIFQQPLSDSYSYSATVEKIGLFPLHRHYELEFVCCIDGKVDFTADSERFTLNSGDIAIIGSLVPHEYICRGENKALVAEIGPMLLKNNFVYAACISGTVILNKNDGEKYDAVFNELNEIYAIRKTGRQDRELFVTGCLYKMTDAAVNYFADKSKKSDTGKGGYFEIEEALTLIHTNYHRQLTVKEAAQKAMMAPANFCSAFKKYTGMGFHEYLNYYRINIARFMLEQTETDIKEISYTSGFSDIKTFYRVFKKETGFPPGEYRRIKN